MNKRYVRLQVGKEEVYDHVDVPQEQEEDEDEDNLKKVTFKTCASERASKRKFLEKCCGWQDLNLEELVAFASVSVSV